MNLKKKLKLKDASNHHEKGRKNQNTSPNEILSTFFLVTKQKTGHLASCAFIPCCWPFYAGSLACIDSSCGPRRRNHNHCCEKNACRHDDRYFYADEYYPEEDYYHDDYYECCPEDEGYYY